ncbi:MAG: DNA gyrase subunit A, partial [Mycoplasmoidaceae bacterium]|nr:DNA gyrase subunit A [Mycoplasmoidaceae bacterium]
MHGNNGSIDGDSPAAMRYTECRLSNFGQLMTENIEKDTVKFIPNFDNSEDEPTVLPTLLPNLLINGSNGIAAGYATNIPPFNFCEVVDAIITRIDSPNCFVSSILKVMPGPDFPTGGVILNTEGIKQCYETGKGKITIRAKIEKVDSKKAVITQIPYETNKSQIIRNISELIGKYDTLNISEVLDESDRNGICIALTLKQGANFDFIKNFLFKNTQLQISYSMNMVAIKDAKPYQMPILFILDAFIEHADNIILSSSKFDLKKASERKEIIEGLIKVIRILD